MSSYNMSVLEINFNKRYFKPRLGKIQTSSCMVYFS